MARSDLVPSQLPAEKIREIIGIIRDNFQLSSLTEITLEANPDDLSTEYLNQLIEIGVNRLSIGIQSFNPMVLKWMNRAHTTEQALNSVVRSKKAGFENISVDLIYGVPLREYELREDLSMVLDLKPAHISAYNLTIEPSTVFGHRLKQGLIEEVSEETAAQSFQLVMDTLRSAGYQHYEISNFTLPGKESRHNLGYWNGKPYLGIGPSAHSFDGSSRQFNISNNPLYIRSIQNGTVPCTVEQLSPRQRINEMIMLALRTSAGLKLQLQAEGLEWDIVRHNQRYLGTLTEQGYARIEKNSLILTDKGKQIADRIAEDLFLDSE